MPATVKCRHGKCEKTFHKLNQDQIKVYDCNDECQENEKGEKPQRIPEPEEVQKESPAQKKSRLAKKAKEEPEQEKAE